jgi:hypothetical protein
MALRKAVFRLDSSIVVVYIITNSYSTNYYIGVYWWRANRRPFPADKLRQGMRCIKTEALANFF